MGSMSTRGRNPFPYTQIMRVDEPWLSHVLTDALFVYREHLESEMKSTSDDADRFDLRLKLCETSAAQEQILAQTINEIGKGVHGV